MVNSFHVVQHVALRDEEVLPAVIIEILEPHTPSGASRGNQPEPRLKASIAEKASAVIVEERINLSRKHGHQDVRSAVIVVILEHRAHT